MFTSLLNQRGSGLEPTPAALPAATAAAGRLHMASEIAATAPGGTAAVLYASVGASCGGSGVTSPPVAASVAGSPTAVESVVVVAASRLLIAGWDQALGHWL
jgi:hypothetical protein